MRCHCSPLPLLHLPNRTLPISCLARPRPILPIHVQVSCMSVVYLSLNSGVLRRHTAHRFPSASLSIARSRLYMPMWFVIARYGG